MHKHVGRKNYNICCIYIGGGGITPRPCTVLRRGGYTPHSMYELYVSDLRSQVCIYIYIHIYVYVRPANRANAQEKISLPADCGLISQPLRRL